MKRLQTKQVQKQQDLRQQISDPGASRDIDKVAKSRGGSNDSNRERGVGSRGYEDDDMSRDNDKASRRLFNECDCNNHLFATLVV